MLVALLFMSSFHLLSMFPHIHFSPAREFLVDFVHSHTAKTVFFEVLSLHLMMAALIGWTQAESFAWDGESTMHAYLPIPIRIGRIKEPADVSPVAWNRSGSPQWCRAQRRWQRTVCKSSVNSTYVVSVAASPCFSIETTCNHVNVDQS